MLLSEKKADREFLKVEKLIAKKDKNGLEKWLANFAAKGMFWLDETKIKYKKDDWL